MLLAPGHNNESYQWIMQTQQMLATREWRLRHVGYDNAPAGRAVVSPSLYRWWLAAVAWGDHVWSGRSRGLAVEHAALWADPLLLMLLVAGGTLLAAARFGPLAAALWPLATAALFPFGGAFLPGAPDSPGLGLVLAVATLLALLGGILPARAGETHTTRWFIAAGIIGGLGLWLNARTTVPLLLGLGAGALVAGWFTRRSPAAVLPWRAWGLAGAATTAACWLLEYAPAHLDLRALRLSEIHPLYALGWLGGGELLARVTAWLRGDKLIARKNDWLRLVLAGLALAAVPGIMILKGQSGFLQENTFSLRLSALGENGEAGNLAKWIAHEGATLRLLAVLAPLSWLVPALLAAARGTSAPPRFALTLLAGPLLVVALFACRQPSWWSLLQALLLVVLVVTFARSAIGETGPRLPAWSVAAILLALLPGAAALTPRQNPAEGGFTKQELTGLAERDFAHWLARRMGPGGANVLAPPDLASSVMYHGGLHALGSAYQENADGAPGLLGPGRPGPGARAPAQPHAYPHPVVGRFPR
jgi:hypothetical protein